MQQVYMLSAQAKSLSDGQCYNI